MNQRKGWRLSAYKAFLKDYVESNKRSNLTVITGAAVDKLSFVDENSTVCNGVTAVINNQPHHFCAEKEVVLCAGSIGDDCLHSIARNLVKLYALLGSVQILERSGIRAYGAPTAADIPVRCERKGSEHP